MKMDRDNYEKQWIEKFKELNQRKPTRLEKLSYRVGFNAGEHYSNKNEGKIR